MNKNSNLLRVRWAVVLCGALAVAASGYAFTHKSETTATSTKSGEMVNVPEINRHPVRNADDAVRLTENTKDKHTLVRVWENGGSHYVVVDESLKG